jgi:hypothetical protein
LQTGLPKRLAHDPALDGYLQRTRRWRTFGVLGGVIGSILWMNLSNTRNAITTTSLFVGWFAAGILPELFVRNRPDPTTRVALLEPRRATRYVTPSAWHWLLAAYLFTAAALVDHAIAGDFTTPSGRDMAMLVAAGAVLTIVGAAAVWRIGRRPQPAGTADDVRVDDAIRTLGTTRAISGWSALQFIIAGYLVPHGPYLGSPYGSVQTAFAIGVVVGVLGSWAWVPTRVQPRVVQT